MNIDYAKVYLRHSYHKPDNVSSQWWLGTLRLGIEEGWLIPRDIMNNEQQWLRMQIRSAYFDFRIESIDTSIAYFLTTQDWHAITCLIELQLTP